jgi:hypothetical protein
MDDEPGNLLHFPGTRLYSSLNTRSKEVPA